MSSEQFSPAGPGEHLQRMLQDWTMNRAARRPAGPACGSRCRRTSSASLTADWSGCCGDGHGVEIQLDKHNRPTVTSRQIYSATHR